MTVKASSHPRLYSAFLDIDYDNGRVNRYERTKPGN
jgi:hypothetical protein